MSGVNKRAEAGIFKPGGFLISWMSEEYLHYVSHIKWVAMHGPERVDNEGG